MAVLHYSQDSMDIDVPYTSGNLEQGFDCSYGHFKAPQSATEKPLSARCQSSVVRDVPQSKAHAARYTPPSPALSLHEDQHPHHWTSSMDHRPTHVSSSAQAPLSYQPRPPNAEPSAYKNSYFRATANQVLVHPSGPTIGHSTTSKEPGSGETATTWNFESVLKKLGVKSLSKDAALHMTEVLAILTLLSRLAQLPHFTTLIATLSCGIRPPAWASPELKRIFRAASLTAKNLFDSLEPVTYALVALNKEKHFGYTSGETSSQPHPVPTSLNTAKVSTQHANGNQQVAAAPACSAQTKHKGSPLEALPFPGGCLFDVLDAGSEGANNPVVKGIVYQAVVQPPLSNYHSLNSTSVDLLRALPSKNRSTHTSTSVAHAGGVAPCSGSSERRWVMKPVAVKILSKSDVMAQGVSTEMRCVEELVVARRVWHPRVVRTYQICEAGELLLLVMEYANQGDLVNLIRSQGCISEQESRHVFSQVLSALIYLHDRGIAHRDVKPENIFLTRSRSASGVPHNGLSDILRWRVLLGDFGAALRLGPNPKRLLTETMGTLTYAAPEILSSTPYTGEAIDVWSLGIVLFAMIYGRVPWELQHSSLEEAYKIVTEQPLITPSMNLKYQRISVECRDLIVNLISINPADRCTLRDIQHHPWLTASISMDMEAEPYPKISLSRCLLSSRVHYEKPAYVLSGAAERRSPSLVQRLAQRQEVLPKWTQPCQPPVPVSLTTCDEETSLFVDNSSDNRIVPEADHTVRGPQRLQQTIAEEEHTPLQNLAMSVKCEALPPQHNLDTNVELNNPDIKKKRQSRAEGARDAASTTKTISAAPNECVEGSELDEKSPSKKIPSLGTNVANCKINNTSHKLEQRSKADQKPYALTIPTIGSTAKSSCDLKKKFQSSFLATEFILPSALSERQHHVSRRTPRFSANTARASGKPWYRTSLVEERFCNQCTRITGNELDTACAAECRTKGDFLAAGYNGIELSRTNKGNLDTLSPESCFSSKTPAESTPSRSFFHTTLRRRRRGKRIPQPDSASFCQADGSLPLSSNASKVPASSAPCVLTETQECQNCVKASPSHLATIERGGLVYSSKPNMEHASSSTSSSSSTRLKKTDSESTAAGTPTRASPCLKAALFRVASVSHTVPSGPRFPSPSSTMSSYYESPINSIPPRYFSSVAENKQQVHHANNHGVEQKLPATLVSPRTRPGVGLSSKNEEVVLYPAPNTSSSRSTSPKLTNKPHNPPMVPPLLKSVGPYWGQTPRNEGVVNEDCRMTHPSSSHYSIAPSTARYSVDYRSDSANPGEKGYLSRQKDFSLWVPPTPKPQPSTSYCLTERIERGHRPSAHSFMSVSHPTPMDMMMSPNPPAGYVLCSWRGFGRQ